VSELIHLRASGVSLLLDVGGGRLPRVLHWGAELGDGDLSGVSRASIEPQVGGELDERHALSVLPEHSWGWMHTPGLSGSRAGRDAFTRFTTTAVTRSGEGSGDGAVERVVVEAADAVAGLELTITLELLGTGLLRTRAAVTSTDDGAVDGRAEPYQLDQLTLLLPVPREATELLDFTGRWIRERSPQRGPFNTGVHLRESRRGKPGHDSAFLIAAGTKGFGFRAGEVWLTHVGWSGNSRHLAERANDGAGLIGGGELLLPGEVRLAQGETYQSPWVYGSYSRAGLDAASTRIHRWLRAHPAHPSGPRPVLVNTWEAAYFDHDHDALRALADAAAEVGAERFVLDDGWFRHRRADNAGLGDWFVDEGIYPEGLGWLADYVRGKGLEFGIWFEPEMINEDSDLARAHPEWIAGPGAGRLPIRAREQQVLDLTHPDAFAYIEERLHAVVGELRPTYIKWDHNRDLVEAANTVTGRPIAREQTLAFYRLLDGLREAFPGLEIETCASGGARVDLGVLERTQRVWTSDSNDPLERQRMQLWTSLIVPPEYMGAHIGPPVAHTTHRAASLDFRAGTALWGHLGIEWNVAGPEASAPDVRAAIAAWVALHKEFRELLHTGDVVRSDLPVEGRILQGVVARDGSEALFSFASIDSVVEQPTGLLRLEGLDPERTYRVQPVGPVRLAAAGPRAVPSWWADAEAGSPVELTGRALAVHGVQAPGLDPQEVVLIRAEAIG